MHKCLMSWFEILIVVKWEETTWSAVFLATEGMQSPSSLWVQNVNKAFVYTTSEVHSKDEVAGFAGVLKAMEIRTERADV